MGGLIETVKYGSVTVRVAPRADGRFHLRWQVNGVQRTTTATTKERALKRALKIAKDLSVRQGSQAVSHADAAALAALREIAPEELAGFTARIVSAVKRLGSWEAVERAVAHYRDSGIETIEETTVSEAVTRFVTFYEHNRSRMTASGIRKELMAFATDSGQGSLAVTELTGEIIKAWISRGDPAPRFYNNRLATWKTFLNRCRQWNYWPSQFPNPTDEIERRREPVRSPQILPIEVARAGLEIARDQSPDLLPYFVLGCWTGLRPWELLRIRWGDFDWKRRALHVRPEVANKTLSERFVPLEKNVIQLLQDHSDCGRYRQRADEAKVCGYKDGDRLSDLFRAAGILDGWPQDVMRHSYISYRIARGDSLARIAEEAGNSEGVIRRRYRRPVMAEEGAAWFSIGLP